jgi:uncharacterized protein (TIGR03546 family)
MLVILKFLQSLVKTLHSDGTPTQIAGGVALGAALGLTPLMNLHNIVVIVLLAILNVSFGAGMVAWGVFVPIGFMLDPLFDRIGDSLLSMQRLQPMWTWMDNAPVFGLSNLNNTVVLGSVVGWLVLFLPVFIASRILVIKYRATLGAWFMRSKFYNAFAASQLYNVYRWFSP